MRGTSFAHCQCLDRLMPFCLSYVKGRLLMHDLCRIEMVGGTHFVSRWWAKKEFAVSTLVPSHVEYSLLYQMLYIPRWPCRTLVGKWTFVGPPFLWRAEQEVRVGTMWGGWSTFLWMSEKAFVVVVNELSWPIFFWFLNRVWDRIFPVSIEGSGIHGHRTLKAPHPVWSAQLTRVPPS